MKDLSYNSLDVARYQQEKLYRQSDVKLHREEIEAIKVIATAAQRQADLAEKKARKADVKGVIALVISTFGLLLEFIINYNKIIDFFRSILVK